MTWMNIPTPISFAITGMVVSMDEIAFSRGLNLFPVKQATTAEIRNIKQVPSCGKDGNTLDTTRSATRRTIGI